MERQGDLVSRLIVGIVRVTIWVIGIINLLTKSKVTLQVRHGFRFRAQNVRLLQTAFTKNAGRIILYMPGRIVLSHLHVVTWRRARSTQRLIFIGLASGGIITPE